MTEATRITYSSRPDATPEAELDTLVNAYAYLIKAHGSRKTATLTPEPDDRDDTAIVTREEGGNGVERDGATTQPRNDETKESKK